MGTPTSPGIRIVVADDHEILREGFNTMVKKIDGIELVGEASDGMELLDLVSRVRPDVVVTDIKMPRLDGIEATRQLVKKFPHIGVVALTMYDDDTLIIDMLEAGAKGYVVKNASKKEIVEAIQTVYSQNTYYCRHTSGRLAQMIARSKFNPYKKSQSPEFNEKEIEVIRYICKEYSTREIASALNLSVRTIEGYREKIEEKMGAKNTAGIVVYAIKKGIFKPE